jgi:hypothetical protein
MQSRRAPSRAAPDVTPIEQKFCELTARLRGLGTRAPLIEAVRRAIDAIICDDAVGWFAQTGSPRLAESSS